MTLSDLLNTDLTNLSQHTLRPVKVAILDTGIDSSHSRLHGKVKKAYGFLVRENGEIAKVHLPPNANNDPSGHGTGVAAIIGILAPNTTFVDYRVLDSDNGGAGSVVLKALEDAVESDVDIINISITLPKGKYWDSVVKLLERAYACNKIVVASKRNIPMPNDLGLPAELSSCISVDCSSFHSPFYIKFLNKSIIEYMANGVGVLTAKPGGGYHRLTGTSFATPTISALVALMRGLIPNLYLFEIKTILKNNSSLKKISKKHINPLELGFLDESTDGFVVKYKCPVCKNEMNIQDIFSLVKCNVCEAITHRTPLMDAHLYTALLVNLKHLIPDTFSYHNYEHARRTVYAIFHLIANSKKLSIKQKRCLLLAGLLHDIGYSQTIENHEFVGANLAEALLRDFDVCSDDILIIKKLILATDPTSTPQDYAEKIMRDADVFYAGTIEGMKFSESLRKEYANLGTSFSDEEWIIKEINFLYSQHFFIKSLEKQRKKERQVCIDSLVQKLKYHGISDASLDDFLISMGQNPGDTEVTPESYCTCPNCRTRFYVNRLAPYVRCPNSKCKMLLPLWGDKF